MVGYVWADESRATASAIVCGTSAEACARAAREIGQNYWDNRRNFAFGMPTGPLEAMLDLSSDGSGPVILADSGDNPTGGGVGDRPDVLRALLQRDRTEALVAGIADAPAARAAAKAGIGEICRLAIGYSLDPVGTPLQVTAHIEHILGETGGLEVLIRISKTRVILTERRRPFHNLVDFRRFGIDPAAIRLLVVKSGYLSPELALLAKPALMALTPGAVNQDILQLTNNFRPRRTYPFNWDVDWAPKAHLSKRWRILA